MIPNLKLANYEPQSHLEKILELGEDTGTFKFLGDSVDINYRGPHHGFLSINYKRDQSDPLNRFKGIFNGRTYGEGKFILITNDEDDLLEYQNNDPSNLLLITRAQFMNTHIRVARKVGCLHTTPELYKC